MQLGEPVRLPKERCLRGERTRCICPADGVPRDVSAMIAITGSVAGLVIYSMSTEVDMSIAAKMIGDPIVAFDALARAPSLSWRTSSRARQASVWRKTASRATCPRPVRLVGHGRSIATFNPTRLVVPLIMSTGEFLVDVAIKEM